MIPLGDFLASLLSDAVRGHAVADRVAGEVARLYREHELLQHFPIPKISVSTIDLDLALSIARYQEVPRLPAGVEDEFRTALVDHLVGTLPGLAETREFVKRMGVSENALGLAENTKKLRLKSAELVSAISVADLLDEKTRTSALGLAASNLVGGIETILKPRRERSSAKRRPAAVRDADRTALQSRIVRMSEEFSTAWWREYLRLNPQIPKDRIPLLSVEPKELEAVPPEKIARAKIRLEMRPYEWTSFEVADENRQKIVKYKLVPE